MASLSQDMTQCDHKHEFRWNFLHGVGIPMILAGIFLFLFTTLGAGFFQGRWMPQFLRHRIEENHPAFFHGPIYLLVGPIWIAREAWMFLTGTHRKPSPKVLRKGMRRDSCTDFISPREIDRG